MRQGYAAEETFMPCGVTMENNKAKVLYNGAEDKPPRICTYVQKCTKMLLMPSLF